MLGLSRTAAIVAGFVLVTGLAWYATTIPRPPSGFGVRYFAGSDQTARPIVTTRDNRVPGAGVRRAWPLANEAFTARWDAYVIVQRGGPYRLSVISDGSSYLSIDDRIVVNNGGPHGPRQVTERVALGAGVHSISLEYSSSGEPFGIDLLWASNNLTLLTPVEGLLVSPTRPSLSDARWRVAIASIRTVIVSLWTIAYLYVVLSHVVVRAMRALVRHHLPTGVPTTVIALLVGVGVLYATAITWGIPGQGWAPDELIPPDFFDALDRHFSHGWWSKYPPAHFYLSAIVSAPLLLWRALDPAAFGGSLAPEIVWLMLRTISVAMGVGATLMVYVCASYLYSASSAPMAAAIAALSLPAVFYAKTANLDVPYLFWFSVSLASFVRILVNDSAVDYILFAVAATLSVCTKDQAYGLFIIPAVALVILAAVRRRGGGSLVISGIAAAAVFALCHNLLFNFAGFMAHVNYITGKGATPFRMFEPTLAGQWQLASATWMLTRVSMGWPLFVLCLAGLAASIAGPAVARRRLWWLLLPAASYYLTFLAVVGFTYDRFLLPLFITLALAGGFFVSALERVSPAVRPWIRAGIGVALVYSVAYVAIIDAALVRDSRYTVERWIDTHVKPGAIVGRIGPIEHVPRLDNFYTVLVEPTIPALRSTSLDYIVANADWVERFGPGRPEFEGYRALREGRLGYHAVFAARTPLRFAGMSLEGRFDAFGSTGYSTLTKLDPPTIVFARDAVNRETPAPSARTP